MKIEKLNDNQIRFTLTGEDLAQRQIKLSELAYGTPKAQALFQEMLRWASYKFGFEVEGEPLMVEAIPITSDTIVVVVTKVAYPDELDPRYSRFTEGSASLRDYEDFFDEEDDDLFSYDEFEDFFGGGSHSSMPKLSYNGSADDILRAYGDTETETSPEADAAAKEASQPQEVTKIYVFQSLEDILPVSRFATEIYCGASTLRKDAAGRYYLTLHQGDTSLADFNRLTNMLAEYALPHKEVFGAESYLAEHYRTILADNALESLAKL